MAQHPTRPRRSTAQHINTGTAPDTSLRHVLSTPRTRRPAPAPPSARPARQCPSVGPHRARPATGHRPTPRAAHHAGQPHPGRKSLAAGPAAAPRQAQAPGRRARTDGRRCAGSGATDRTCRCHHNHGRKTPNSRCDLCKCTHHIRKLRGRGRGRAGAYDADSRVVSRAE